MNSWVLSFTDGRSFFAGLAIASMAVGVAVRFRRGAAGSAATVGAIVGVILVTASATPLPVWVYAVWLAAMAAALTVRRVRRASLPVRAASAVVAVAASAALAVGEAPYHRMPRVVVPAGKKVYVLGDSISAGLGSTKRCWPTVLQERTGFSVVSLAQAGARVEDAVKQAEAIADPGAVVLVEIGGNDLLGGTDAAAFAEHLDRLIGLLHAGGHPVVMFELPLAPFKNGFGRAQRLTAARYEAALLPKRCMTQALDVAEGTLDGLHLSRAGHETLAELVAECLVTPSPAGG